MKRIKCYKCKSLAVKAVPMLKIGICEKCADKLLVAAILTDIFKKKKLGKIKV